MKRVLLLAMLGACAGNITSDDSMGDDTTTPDAAGPMVNEAVARGLEWVAVKVPYCQAPNHAHDNDADCPSTCTRPDNPAWDPYRSDCSGFVSWAWNLPPPGRVTGTFAPFNTEVTHVIAAADLMPGDAVNNDHHMMLFETWVTPGVEATFMDEPGCSSATPYAHEFTATVTLDGNSITVKSHGTFTAIRH